MKFTIGRNRKCHIWMNSPEVSDKHAEVWIEENVVVIEDLNSSNGTFKNGRRIFRTQLQLGDELKIAGIKVPYEALKLKIEEITKGNDYSIEFYELKALYTNYKKELQKIKRVQQKKPMIFRILLSMVPVLVSVLLWDIIDPSLRYVIMIGGSSLIFGVTSLISLSQEKNTNEKIETLSDEFQIKYVCPKCKARQGIVSWVVLASQKKCKICGAIWINEQV